MKRISLLLSLICFVGFAHAQFVNDYLGAADKYFTKGDYYSAAQYYEKYLESNKSKTKKQAGYQPYAVSAATTKKITVTSNSKEKVIYNLAESYRKLHFHEKAAPYYMEASNFNKTAFPLAKFHYATTLRAMEKYDEATTFFTAFLQEYPTKDKYAATAAREIENLQFIKQQMARKNLEAYKVEKSSALNAEGGSYAPVWMSDNTLWFTSTRPLGTEKNKTTTNRIYQIDYNNGAAGTVSLSTVPQDKDMQQGVLTVTPDGNTIFLTRWVIANDKKTAAIYQSKKMNGTWSEPVLSAGLNETGSNSQQPFVMPDGKHIIFSTDRPGGWGGFDLWMANMDENGNVSAAANMGMKVNTEFDEQAASYHAASKTFVFSSNGRVGMGGYDFYYCKGELDNLSEPKNFGYPVNSEKDDLYFISKGTERNILENVIMSSDRDAACCLELYSLKRLKALKQLTGIVLACVDNKPMSGVNVEIIDTINNKVIAGLTTDASGRYSFTLEDFLPLKAIATNDGYFKSSIKFKGPADEEEVNFTNPEICLTKIPEPEAAVKVDNVYYDFNKSSLQKKSFASLDKLVGLLNDNPELTIELGAHTDSKGTDEYNQKLSDARAKTVVKYLISKGINKDRLIATGYGETVPVADNSNADGTDNPDGRQENRRTEFKVLKK